MSRRDWAIYVVTLGVLLGAVFGPHLGGEWVWDDVYLIRDNPNLGSVGGLWVLVTHDLWGGAGQAPASVYRPIPVAFIWAVARLADRSVVSFHVANLAVHASVVLLLFAWLRRRGLPPRGAAFASLVFAVHPVATEPVLWISGCHDLLGSLACLASLLLWPRAGDRHARIRIAGASVAVAAAALCKEPYFAFPAVLLVAVAFDRDALPPIRRLAPVGFAFFALVLVLALRRHLGIPTSSSQIHAPISEHLRNYATIVAHYGAQGLSFQSPPTTGVFRTVSTPLALLVLAIAGAFVRWALVLWRRNEPFAGEAVIGLGWFLIALIPHVFSMPLIGMFGNRYAYFPTMGLVVAALAFASPLSPRLAVAPFRALRACAPAALAAIALLTAGDAQLFRNELALFGADLTQDPKNPQALYHYGHAVRIAKGCGEALPYFERATELSPTFARAWHNVAGCLIELRRYDDALPAAVTARSLQPTDAGAAYNLAVALLAHGQRREALALLEEALRLDPGRPNARALLAKITR